MRFVSRYTPSYLATLVYMLQSTEYQVGDYLRWYMRVDDFRGVARRRTLARTKVAKLLLAALLIGVLIQVAAGLFVTYQAYLQTDLLMAGLGGAIIISYPFTWAYIITAPVALGRAFIISPREQRHIATSKRIFADHPATIIGVAGSYGKTTMKELLLTVLSEGKKTAATPANKNVALSHAAFARKLKGDEEVLIIEYGEGAPGDVRRFADTTDPDIGIITGVAPAHLDRYKTLDAAARDIFSLADHLGHARVYVNSDSRDAAPYIRPEHITYDSKKAGEWNISGIKIGLEGTSFTMKKGSHTLNLSSGLLGRHQVGPLAAAAAIASDLGLSKQQIEAGVARTSPFEHRMQPRRLPGGVWIIDDTYNGNLDGMRAGLALLSEVPARRRIYVTPGLVDQGDLTDRVHQELGRLIAASATDLLVLMHNSVTHDIRHGLEQGGYKGELRLEDDPLGFYTGIDQFVAQGDVVLMQNDWTDNYS
jgi:UDP-N-acetylmuramoyl-tripeptide--D-alanyl-D-alanine ligase